MNKLLQTIILLLCCYSIFGEHVALIGDSAKARNIADLVLTNNSDKSQISFLERISIDKVIREHQLSQQNYLSIKKNLIRQFPYVDLIVTISSIRDWVKRGNKYKPETRAMSVLIFNAKNGFLLGKHEISIDEEKAAKEIIQAIQQALTKNRSKDKTLISVYNYRLIGLSGEVKGQIPEFATQLEQTLTQNRQVIVLTRDYLDQIARERNLTNKRFALAPSTLLLRLEFLQGEKAGLINLIARITGTDKKELFRIEIKNCLTDTDQSIQKISKAIGEWAENNKTKKFSRAQESQWLKNEYLFLARTRRNHKEAYFKISAAASLSPGDSVIRLEELKALRFCVPVWLFNDSKPIREQYVRYVINLADKYNHDFPQANNGYNSVSYLFECHKRSYNLTGYRLKPTPDYTVKQTRELRVKYMQECSRKYPFLNLADGINSIKEFDLFATYKICGINMYNMYHNPNEYSKDVVDICGKKITYILENPQEVYRKYGEGFYDSLPNDKRTPHLINKLIYYELFYVLGLGLNDERIPYNARLIVLKNCKPIAQLLQQQDVSPMVREVGVMLENYSNYFNGIVDERVFFQEIANWMDKNREELTKRDPDFRYFFSKMLKEGSERNRYIALWKKTSMKPDKQPTGNQQKSWQQFMRQYEVSLRRQKALQFIINNIDYLKNPRNIQGRNFLKQTAGLYLSQCNLPEAQKLLNSAYPKLAIEYVTKLKGCSIKFTAFYKNKLYYLSNKKLYCYDLNSGKSYQVKFKPDIKFNQAYLTVEDDKILLSCYFMKLFQHPRRPTYYLYVIPLDGTPHIVIKNFPMGSVKIMNNRYYVMTHENEIYSCDFSGNNRKIEISGKREDLKNKIDHMVKFKSGEIALNRMGNLAAEINAFEVDPVANRLLIGIFFNRLEKNNGIWEYYPETGKTNLIKHGVLNIAGFMIYPNNNSQQPLEFANSVNLYDYLKLTSVDTKQHRFLLYNMRRKFSRIKSKQKFIETNFFGVIQPGKLWTNRELYLQDGTKINLPISIRTTNCFPFPDGKSVLVMYSNKLLKISLK